MLSMFLQVELCYIVKCVPEERKTQLNKHTEVNDEFLLSKQTIKKWVFLVLHRIVRSDTFLPYFSNTYIFNILRRLVLSKSSFPKKI